MWVELSQDHLRRLSCILESEAVVDEVVIDQKLGRSADAYRLHRQIAPPGEHETTYQNQDRC